SIYIIPTAGSIYEYTVRGIGDENVCRYAYTNPGFLEDVFRDSTFYTIEVGKQFIEEGAEVLFIFEDYAYKHGPFLHPRLWRKLVFPRLREAVNAFHKRGALVLVHSDGNILPLMNMIIEAGVDGIHSLEPAAGIDIKEVKEKYGDKICLIGNIDVGNLLPYGSVEDVAAEVKKVIRAAAPGGGYILSSCSTPTDMTKPENFAAQVKAGKKYGKYRCF
ncbi:MAG: uroporphyrinogen decarboxylase family protein, partial [Thermoproteota archaeon]